MKQLVYERFGSKNGFVRYFYHSFLDRIGVYRRFSHIRPKNDQRIVFICSGNICRSPLAEVYANSLGKQAASCGLNCGEGYSADPRAREFARERGLTLQYHKTVNVENFEFLDSDFIVVMEPSHINQFRQKVGTLHPLVLAGSYCRNPTPYIHDPFNCCSEFFSHCEDRVMEAVRGICGK